MSLPRLAIRPPSALDQAHGSVRHDLGRWIRRFTRRSCFSCKFTFTFFALVLLIVYGSLNILSRSQNRHYQSAHGEIISFLSPSRFLASDYPQAAASQSSARTNVTPTTYSKPVATAHPAVIAANERVDEFLEFQSKSLVQARARYTLRTRNPPPPQYDEFYNYAVQHKCLIDSYEQVAADFAPWYQLTKTDPSIFVQRLARAWDITATSNKSRMQAFTVEKGNVSSVGQFEMPYKEEWVRILTWVSFPLTSIG